MTGTLPTHAGKAGARRTFTSFHRKLAAPRRPRTNPMTQPQGWHRLKALLLSELAELVRINPSDRPWQMPFAAALATGLPLLVGAYFDHMEYGLISSLGGLTFLYLPNTPLYHRMVSLMACGFMLRPFRRRELHGASLRARPVR